MLLVVSEGRVYGDGHMKSDGMKFFFLLLDLLFYYILLSSRATGRLGPSSTAVVSVYFLSCGAFIAPSLTETIMTCLSGKHGI